MDGSLTGHVAKRLRTFRAILRGERVAVHKIIVGSGTILAGALGVAFQSLVSHRLEPADYGAVFALVHEQRKRGGGEPDKGDSAIRTTSLAQMG